MQSKPLTSVALLFMLLLLGQAFTGHLNQIPGEERNTEFDSSNIVMFSNNSTDTDGDGIYDTVDDCPNGSSNWTSTIYTDHDSDGCQDSNEDLDDDNDGLVDAFDSCPVGSLGWSSSNSTDADGDGCRDSTEDSDGGGSGGGNQTSSCGSNASNVWFEVEAYQPEWNASDTVSVFLDTYCGIWNNSYKVSWGLIDNATNSIIDFGNTSFVTNPSSVSYHPNHTYHFNEYDIHLHYIDTGNYTVFGHFSVWSNNSWMFLSNQSYTFEVNSTMTTTVCGFNSTFIEMQTDMQSTLYYAGSPVHPWSDIECPMLNTMYTYTWEMYNLNTSTITHSGMQNFTATWQNVNMFTDGSGFYHDLYPHAYNLTEGIYILTTTLSSTSGVLVETNNVSFSVWANPVNNTPNGSDCLHLRNISVNSSYYVFVELENSCSIDIHYPGINATTDDPGVSGLYDTWWYLLWANGTYDSGWQLSFNESVQNNTPITLNISAAILNCGPNGYHACPNSINSSSSYQFTYITASGNNPGGNNSGGNNTGGNNTGGNNTGGNNTGGNNTGGNNTGGNNTGGNNTGGNNTGGNNTGGNNTGGNNTGGNNTGGNNTGGNNTGGNNTGEDPIACCEAVNAQCLACAAGMTVEAYCLEYPDTTGCAEDGNNTGGNNTDSNDGGNEIPSLGMVGTVVAISAGFLLSIRREDEE